MTHVPFVAYWSTGDRYKFQVIKLEYRTKNGEVSKDDTTRYVGVFEVLDSTATSYQIEWSYENYRQTNGASQKLAQLLAQSAPQLTNLKVRYTTDEFGEFQQVDNMDEIMAAMKASLDIVYANLEAKDDLPPGGVATIRRLTAGMMTPAYVQNTILADITSIHALFGGSYPIKDTLFYEEELPTAFGGQSIRGDGQLFVDTIDVADDYVHIKQYLDLNPEDTRQMMTEFFQSLKENMPITKKDTTDFASFLQDTQFEIRDDNDYYFYYYPGIPIYLDIYREMVMKFSGQDAVIKKQLLIEWIE